VTKTSMPSEASTIARPRRSSDNWQHTGMKLAGQLLTLLLFLALATPSRAAEAGIATCGPNDAYVTLYSSIDTFEMQKRLACGEKVELLEEQESYGARHTPFIRIRTEGGIEGYLARAAVTILPGRTEPSRRRAGANPVGPPPAVDNPDDQTLNLHEVRLLDGTELEVALSADLSSEHIAEGAVVSLAVARPFVIHGVTVFERGAVARARITAVRKAARWGRNGEISWTMQNVTAIDGDRIPARFIEESQNTGAAGDAPGFVAAAGNTLLVEQSSFRIHKGDPAFIPAGQLFKIVLHGDVVVKLPSPRGLPPSGDAPAATAHR
jgi:hypothetical protein